LLRMIRPPTFTYHDFLPFLSVLTFLGCTVMAARNLFAQDRGGARAAYIWLSLPGTLVAALAIGQLLYVAYSIPGAVSSPFAAWFILIYATYNPGWIIFPTVLVGNAVSKSSNPGDGFSLLMCCLLAALWLWGLWIDNNLLPRIMDALA
jgi:hypothetical protein